MTGQLPFGVDYSGKTHREFELRPQLVEDIVEVYEDSENGARAEKNSWFAGVCLFARRLVKLGDIPKDAITPALLMKMRAEDLTALQAADRGLLRPGKEGQQG
jgi:hypothetical protein